MSFNVFFGIFFSRFRLMPAMHSGKIHFRYGQLPYVYSRWYNITADLIFLSAKLNENLYKPLPSKDTTVISPVLSWDKNNILIYIHNILIYIHNILIYIHNILT